MSCALASRLARLIQMRRAGHALVIHWAAEDSAATEAWRTSVESKGAATLCPESGDTCGSPGAGWIEPWLDAVAAGPAMRHVRWHAADLVYRDLCSSPGGDDSSPVRKSWPWWQLAGDHEQGQRLLRWWREDFGRSESLRGAVTWALAPGDPGDANGVATAGPVLMPEVATHVAGWILRGYESPPALFFLPAPERPAGTEALDMRLSEIAEAEAQLPGVVIALAWPDSWHGHMLDFIKGQRTAAFGACLEGGGLNLDFVEPGSLDQSLAVSPCAGGDGPASAWQAQWSRFLIWTQAAGVECESIAADLQILSEAMLEAVPTSDRRANQNLRDRARSAAERTLHVVLEQLPSTRNIFQLNHSLDFKFGYRTAEGDLVAPAERLVIEIDGWFHFRGHEDYRRDRRKDLLMQQHGWQVLRVLADDIPGRLPEITDEINVALRQCRRQRPCESTSAEGHTD